MQCVYVCYTHTEYIRIYVYVYKYIYIHIVCQHIGNQRKECLQCFFFFVGAARFCDSSQAEQMFQILAKI